MKFDDQGLGERGDGDGFFDFGGDVTHAEFQGAERGMRANVPPDFFAGIDAIQFYEEVDKIFVGAPGFELFGDAGARKAAEDGGAERFEAGVAAHPERRAGGQGQEMREEIADHVHHVDGGLLIGHGDVDVHAKDQEGAGELLEFLDDVLVPFAGRDDLVDPAGEGMSPGGGNVEAGAVGGGYEFVAGAVHFDAQLSNVFADVAAGFNDGLMHLVLDLIGDARGSGGDELHYVRAQCTGGGVDNLEFFFDADGEAVSHGGPSGGSVESEDSEGASYSRRDEKACLAAGLVRLAARLEGRCARLGNRRRR